MFSKKDIQYRQIVMDMMFLQHLMHYPTAQGSGALKSE